MIKVLRVGQFSKIGNAIIQGRKVVEVGYSIWTDTGEKVTTPYPGEWRNTREQKYIRPVYKYKYTFAELCEMFPDCVTEIESDYKAGWGCGYYEEGESGYASCRTSNYDSSD